MKSMTLFMCPDYREVRRAQCSVLSALVGRGYFDRQLFAVTPFLPGPNVGAHARVAEESECDVRVRGAVSALAVSDDLAFRRHARVHVHLAKLRGGLEFAGRGQVSRPLDVDRSGNGAAPSRAHGRP